VSHTDPETLALLALGEPVGSAPHEHTMTCADCRSELARLSEVVALARHGEAEHLETPPDAVWQRIAGQLRDGGQYPRPIEETGHDGHPAARTADRARPGWRHSRAATALAGLAAGLIIGSAAAAGIAHLISAPATSAVARIELRPLPQFPQWHSASGTAVMQATRSQRLLIVSLRAPARPGFYEVWLLGRNGVSMISLGDLDSAHTGRFVIPPGTDLRFYSRIDVSLQPFNGSTLHSRTSVVRGSLPPTAMSSGRGGSAG